MPIVSVGLGLPANLPQISILSLLTMSRFGPNGWRVWHARRNSEMLAGLALRILLRKRLKLIFTSASQRNHSQYTRWLISRMDAVLATSDKSASYLKCQPHIISHGIDTVEFSPTDDKRAVRSALGLPIGGKLIGCFGRIRSNKGTDLFISTAINLCRRHADLNAVVLGQAIGSNKAFLHALEQRVRTAGLEDRIFFRERVPFAAIADMYRALDLYVAPQRWEGFGLTPIEAMACGVPVVAADVGTFRSQIVHGETGFIVAPGSASKITDAVEVLLLDHKQRAEFALSARAHVQINFDIQKEAEALVQIYRRLMTQ
ncbi:glycosyl transferase family 1 [Gemmobacter aquarius]|uniref:Glycosyl transferase family 1 n=1 Tax=Paragemmobacter aquarius TaxID=2169400 RepID=A0A2S0UK36_9RHOB|nr:glycosyl transferase family 1 [Gemmobacter aquarius]